MSHSPLLMGAEFNRGNQVTNSKQRYIDKDDCLLQRQTEKKVKTMTQSFSSLKLSGALSWHQCSSSLTWRVHVKWVRKNQLEDQAAKQVARDESKVLKSPPLTQEGMFIFSMLYMPEERKGATYKEVTKIQEDWIITTDLKIIIIEMSLLIQQAH